MKKQKKATKGEKIAKQFFPDGTVCDAIQRVRLAKQIDSTIRCKSREAFWDGHYARTVFSEEKKVFEKKYGVKL